MAYWGSKPRFQVVSNPPVYLGQGENLSLNSFEIQPSEASYSRNTTSKNYPSLSVRNGITKMFGTGDTPLTTIYALGQRNNTFPYVLDDTTLKRWDGAEWQDVKTELSDELSTILEFNTAAKKYTIIANSTEVYSYDGTTVAAITDAPKTRLYAIDDYRLYGLLGNTLKASSGNSITDWTTAGDADTITISSMKGDGTAIIAYNDAVICWSEQSMHLLYGDDPENYSMSDPIEIGCIAARTPIIHNGILYFLDYGKFFMYTTGLPMEVSQKVRTYLEGINVVYNHLCCTGKSGKYIYLSIPYGEATANNITLEYDTEFGTWYVHNFGINDFVQIGDSLYGSDGTTVYEINNNTYTSDDGTAIAWEHITGVWNEKVLSQKKVISDIWVLCDLPVGSTLNVSYNATVDGTEWTSLKDFTASAAEQNTRIQIPTTHLQNIDWYRLKFSGSGPCVIHYIEVHYRVKAR